MKKMMAMLLAGMMAAGSFSTTAFAYTGETAEAGVIVQETAAESAANVAETKAETEIEVKNEGTAEEKSGKSEDTDIDTEMQVLPEGYEMTTDADGNTIVTIGDKQYNLGGQPEKKQTGTVVSGIRSLHFRSGAGTSEPIIGYLHSGDQVEVIGQIGDWYQVSFNGTTGYVHGRYLNVTESSEGSSFNEDALKLFLDLMQSNEPAKEEETESSGLTPEGNMTLVDDLGEEEDKSSQQFITMVTKAGNTFYLIIDRDSDGNQNVHFLNMVDEADLLDLMDEDEAAKYQTQETEATEKDDTEASKESAAEGEENTEDSEKETGKKERKSSTLPLVMLLLFVVGAGGVGGYLYIKMKSGNPASKNTKPDPDADYHDEDEEALELPEESEEDEDSEDDDTDVNADYEAEIDDEPV